MFEGLVEAYGTFGLFISAFVSSTLAPGGSEAVLVYLVSNEPENSLKLVLIATAGNTLGALTTYFLGYLASFTQSAKSLNEQYFEKAHDTVIRYGSIALLFSWLPLIGDVLCLAAGWLKLHFIKALVFIILGKFARYYVLAHAVN